MKFSLLFCFLAVFFLGAANAQDDETRQSSGLPIPIGGNTAITGGVPLSGKLTIQGLEKPEVKPTFFALVFFGGALIDKGQVNDAGYFYVRNVPRQGSVLVIEMNGLEIGRYNLMPIVMGSIRHDVIINWTEVSGTKEKAGVISAKYSYERNAENQRLFEKARSAAKEKSPDNAIKLFMDLVKNDSKDFVAWTELGTLYFKNENFSEAEEAYQKALKQKPDFIVALVNLGKLLLVSKQADKAIPLLAKAVETEPGSADAQHYLGEAYLQTKKGSKAAVYLNEAIRLAPVEKAEIHLRLAALYNAAGLKDKAAEEYKLFLKKVPRYPEKEKIEKYIKENSPRQN